MSAYRMRVLFTFVLSLLVGLATLPLWAQESNLCTETLARNRPVTTASLVQPLGGGLIARPRLILISAPSGGGKTTLMKMLLQDYPGLFEFAVSTTTRAPRTGEVDGVDYNFITPAQFAARLQAGDFLEHAQVHGNFYGSSRSVISAALKKGHSPLLLIDVQGASQVRQQYNPADIFSIFIVPPDMATLEKRLRGRGTDTEETIQKRLKAASQEMQRANEFNAVLVNGDLASAYQKLLEILQQVQP